VFLSQDSLSCRLCRACRQALTHALSFWLIASGGSALAATGPSSDQAAEVSAALPEAPTAEPEASDPEQNDAAPPHDEGDTLSESAPSGDLHTGKLPSVDCLARTLCEVKDKIRWQTPRWTPAECRTLAGEILKAAEAHDVSPTLLLAVMINESDLNEKAVRLTFHGPKVYARDGGLMGIRCMPDAQDKCTNGYVRGIPWRNVMDPHTNIELGAAELARWRTGGITKKTVRVRTADGGLRVVTRNVPCQHKSHGFWAHYNHGPRYIDQGYARHYPHRVAVLDHAVAEALGTDAPELKEGHITMQDPGKRERRADRPVEARYRKLYAEILSAAGKCEAPAYAYQQ